MNRSETPVLDRTGLCGDELRSWLEFEATAVRNLALGAVIRETREKEGIGVRDLARRAGLDPSRVSRIETGRTNEPDRSALDAIADALGRPCEPLYWLASEDLITEDNVEALDPELWRQLMAYFPELCEDDATNDRWVEGSRKAARLMFLHGGPSVEMDAEAPSSERELMQEIARALPALTQQRRDMLRAYVADLVALADLERRGRHPHPYSAAISFEDEA